jgi:hypothetical protein
MLRCRGLVVPVVGMLIVGVVALGVWSTAPVLASNEPGLVQSLIQSGKATPISGVVKEDDHVVFVIFTVILVTAYLVLAKGVDPEYIDPTSIPGVDLTIFDH